MWAHFFADYATHYTDAAYAGGRVSVSVLTRLAGAGFSDRDLRRTLERTMRDVAEWQDSGVAVSEEQLGRAAEKRTRPLWSSVVHLTARGGDSGLLGHALPDVSPAVYRDWLQSVRQRPAVVRYNVRSLAELVEDSDRRTAMEEAIHAWLRHQHAEWEARPSTTLALSQEARTLAEGSVAQLRQRRQVMVAGLAALEKRMALVEDCTGRLGAQRTALEQCSAERTAFRTSVVTCENRFLHLETMEDKTRECELR